MVLGVSSTQPEGSSAPAAWSSLDAAAKRARILAVADGLFTASGLEVPMPAVARAVGVGVGSIYRQFRDKDALVLALVLARFERTIARLDQALDEPDPGGSLRRAVLDLVDRASTDRVAWEAFERRIDDSDLIPPRATVHERLTVLVARAREAGDLRPDVDADDVRMIFAGARAAEQSRPGAGHRLAAFVLDGQAAGGR